MITAALLQPDGKVLVVGSVRTPAFHAEVYDPATGHLDRTRLCRPDRIGFKVETLLSDGTVLMTDR